MFRAQPWDESACFPSTLTASYLTCYLFLSHVLLPRRLNMCSRVGSPVWNSLFPELSKAKVCPRRKLFVWLKVFGTKSRSNGMPPPLSFNQEPYL